MIKNLSWVFSHENISMTILPPKFIHLGSKKCALSIGSLLEGLLRNRVLRITDCLDMGLAVDDWHRFTIKLLLSRLEP